MTSAFHVPDRAQAGVAGLDEISCGGPRRDRIDLEQGDPGEGKTTLALQAGSLDGIDGGD